MRNAEEECGLRGGGGVASERGEMRRAPPFQAAPFSHSASELTSHLYSRLISRPRIPHSSSAFCIGSNSRIPHSSRVSNLNPDPAFLFCILHWIEIPDPAFLFCIQYRGASGSIGSTLAPPIWSRHSPLDSPLASQVFSSR